MAKKLVVQRNRRKPQKGGAPYLKYLVFSAIGLIFLVVITPYLLRDKSREETRNRPVPERGAITKKLPKQVQQQPAPENLNQSATATTTPQSAGATIPAASTSPEAVNPPQALPAPEPAAKGVAAQQEASQPGTINAPPPAASEKASAPAQPAQTPQTARKVLFPQKANRSGGAAAGSENLHANTVTNSGRRMHRKKTAFSAKPAPKPETPQSAEPAVSARPSGRYVVQVGSVFRNFGQAQSLRNKLAAEGYRTSIRLLPNSGYLVVTSPSTRSTAYTEQVQMNAGGLRNTKVVEVHGQQ